MALKSALPPMEISFNPHVNCTLELTATSFHGASVVVLSTSSTLGGGPLILFTGIMGPDPTPLPLPDPLAPGTPVVPAAVAAAAAAAAAITAGWPLLNLEVEKNR